MSLNVAYINRGEVEKPKLSKKQQLHEELMQMMREQEQADKVEAIAFFKKIFHDQTKKTSRA